MQTLRELLHIARKRLVSTSDTADVDASILLCHVLKVERAVLHTWPLKNVSDDDAQTFLNFVTRRERGEPIAYLIGHREFWTLDLMITPDCLIPRPETELLVECALKMLPEDFPVRVADVGTGSGAIALALAHSRPHWQVWAGDLSREALCVAKQNAEAYGLTQIHWLESSYLQNFPRDLHAVISNPPYIAEEDLHLQQGDCRFEPRMALVAEEDGLAAIRSIARDARDHLRSGGSLMLEHGATQGQAVLSVLESLSYHRIQIHRDFADLDRVTSAVWP